MDYTPHQHYIFNKICGFYSVKKLPQMRLKQLCICFSSITPACRVLNSLFGVVFEHFVNVRAVISVEIVEVFFAIGSDGCEVNEL